MTFRQKAASIISDFCSQSKTSDPEVENLRFIETTVKLIKTDIKSVVQSKDIYPTTIEMSSIDMTSSFLPNSLQHFRQSFGRKG